ncbi:MAG: NTP transferase domain-containing protein [Bacteroidota bacterium]
MNEKEPKLYGLVLGGGKSTRMGTDKRLLKYYEVSQQQHAYNLLSKVCENTFLSVREEQISSSERGLNVIVDENKCGGPFNGILSAHNAYPDVAWLVLACDLPLLDRETLTILVTARNPGKAATSMATRKTNLPEPLITIWEPQGLKKAKKDLECSKNSCPRKFLLNSQIDLAYPKNDEVLFNANSKTDFEYIQTKLNSAVHG